jgi:hypothetical protein
MLALGGGAIAAFVLALARAYYLGHYTDDLRGPAIGARYMLSAHGVAIAAATLLVAGLGDLRRRLPRASSGLLVAGAVGLLAAALARVVYQYWVAPTRDFAAVLDGYRWLARLDVTAAVAFAAGLTFLGAESPRVRGLTVPLLVLALLSHPPEMISEWLTRTLQDHPGSPHVWTAALVHGALRAGYGVLALFVLREGLRAAEPAPAPWYIAAEGFFRAGAALSARVAIVVVSAVVLVLAIGVQSRMLGNLWLFGTPAVLLIAAIAQVVGMLRAASLEIAESPRMRLYLGAAATVWSFAVTSIQAIVAYQMMREHDVGVARGIPTVLQVAAPLVGLCGLLCFVSAIGAIAAHVEGEVTPARATRIGVIVVACTGVAVALHHWMLDGIRAGTIRNEGTMVVVALAVAAANAAALIAVARLAQQLAGDLHAASDAPAGLPRAELRDS